MKEPKPIKRPRRKLNPGRLPEINLPEFPKMNSAELRIMMEKQWERGAVNSGYKKARWKS